MSSTKAPRLQISPYVSLFRNKRNPLFYDGHGCLLEECYVIFNILKGLEVPIWYGLPAGHTSTGALTLPFGVEISLDAGEKWFQVEESAVVEGG